MRQALVTLALLLLTAMMPSGRNTPTADADTTATVTAPTAADTLWAMAEAFAWVESKGDHMAYNEREDAVGLLQIRPIMVREANRLLGEEAFTLADRWEPLESIDIFCTIVEHKNPKLDIDRAIDIWNPRCPAAYRNAVKAEYQDAINNL